VSEPEQVKLRVMGDHFHRLDSGPQCAQLVPQRLQMGMSRAGCPGTFGESRRISPRHGFESVLFLRPEGFDIESHGACREEV
jgi:hypothetical protein